MTRDDIRATVERHSCWIRGVRYTFRHRWAAVDRPAEAAPARVLLRVDVMSSHLAQPAAKLHMLAALGAPAQLPALLTDALQHEFAPPQMPGGLQYAHSSCLMLE